MGIEVMIVYKEYLTNFDENELDFGLFDTLGVSFWGFSGGQGREFRLVTAPETCIKYADIFERVSERCLSIPGKEGNGTVVFETEEEFERWLERSSKVIKKTIVKTS